MNNAPKTENELVFGKVYLPTLCILYFRRNMKNIGGNTNYIEINQNKHA